MQSFDALMDALDEDYEGEKVIPFLINILNIKMADQSERLVRNLFGS